MMLYRSKKGFHAMAGEKTQERKPASKRNKLKDINARLTELKENMTSIKAEIAELKERKSNLKGDAQDEKKPAAETV